MLNANLVVSVVGGVEFVTDEGSATDHLTDGEDAVSLHRVDADLFPGTLCEELGPVSFVGDLGVDVTVCGGDRVYAGGGSEGFGDVHLFGDVGGDLEVVLDRLGVTAEETFDALECGTTELLSLLGDVVDGGGGFFGSTGGAGCRGG